MENMNYKESEKEGNKLNELRLHLANLKRSMKSMDLNSFESEHNDEVDVGAKIEAFPSQNENYGFEYYEQPTPPMFSPQNTPPHPVMQFQNSNSGLYSTNSPAMNFLNSPNAYYVDHEMNQMLPPQPISIGSPFHSSISSPPPHLENIPMNLNYQNMMPYEHFMSETRGRNVQPEVKKSRVCRHFLRGYCKMGDECNFYHSVQTVTPSDQIVFLGGLPNAVPGNLLVEELKKHYEVEVVGEPRVSTTFCPRVAFATKKEAQKLIELKKITIFDREVDVRPFKDNHKTSEETRMVFLGGLPDDVKVKDLMNEMYELGYPVTNTPRLGQGYARNVQLESSEKANDLIRKKSIVIFDKMVDVRPYVNIYADGLLHKQYQKKQQNNSTY